MNSGYLKVEHSQNLCGEVTLSGAKNAVLVTIASLLLTRGKSVLKNVPKLADVYAMSDLLRSLGATVFFDENLHILEVDTSAVNGNVITELLMKQMRTSVLAMGPLLACYGSVTIEGMPGGDAIGSRPIDYHLNNFKKMGVVITQDGDSVHANVTVLSAQEIVLAYPSVGATENIMMLATRACGTTRIINAALEPEVIDLIAVLQKMGARIAIEAPATIVIEGTDQLVPIEHTIMCDRLEAGSLLIAVAATGGQVHIPNADAHHMHVFLHALETMGHTITIDQRGKGIHLRATQLPKSVSFKTSPYPGFPTDLQAPMVALQTVAHGKSIIEETVFENRFLHIPQLQKMGAEIEVNYSRASVAGARTLHGAHVVASDIRAAMALVVAGLVAHGTTIISGVHHWKRGYDGLENKLALLGAKIELCTDDKYISTFLNKEKNVEI